MLDIIVLILVSIYYFWHGLYPLLTGKPCLKASGLRKVIVYLLIIEFVIILVTSFMIFIQLYGYTYGGIKIGNSSLYFLMGIYIVLTFMLWIFLRRGSGDVFSIKHSVCLVAISSEYALPAVYDTLAEMKIKYKQVISGFEITDKDLTIKVMLSSQQIYFSVDSSLDKIFLNQFCKKYQTIYKKQQYPVLKRFCWLSSALGLIFLILFVLLISSYVFTLYDIVLHSMAIFNDNR